MKYTAEQLAKMSDLEIDMAVHAKISNAEWYLPTTDPRNKSSGIVFRTKSNDVCATEKLQSYCSDWSATGPLMVEYGVALMQSANDDEWCAEISEGSVDNFACNKNPLRAICEVILMMENDK